MAAAVWYPATSAVSGAPLDRTGIPYPLIIQGHGYMTTKECQFWMASHLASWGFVVVLPDFYPIATPSSDGILRWAEEMNDTLTAAVNWNSTFGHKFFGALDVGRVGAAGFSCGGGAALTWASRDPRIGAVCCLAPFGYVSSPNPIDACKDVRVPVLIQVGDRDAMAPASLNSQPMYANLRNPPKEMSRIIGGNHAQFTQSAVPADSVAGISIEKQHEIANRYMTGWFLDYLYGDHTTRYYYWGTAAAADQARGEVSIQYEIRSIPPDSDVHVRSRWSASRAVTVDVEATDNNGFGMRNVSLFRSQRTGGWTFILNATGPSTAVLLPEDGDFKLATSACDSTGASSSTFPEPVALGIDTVAPRSTVGFAGLKGSGGWYRSNVTCIVTAWDETSGVSKVMASVDGAGFVECRATNALAINGSGRHAVGHRSVDLAGNVETLQYSTVWLDVEPPTLRLVSPTPESHLKAGSELTFELRDDVSGPANLAATVDSGRPLTTNGSVIVLPRLGEGHHIVTVIGSDKAGNNATLSFGYYEDDGSGSGSYSQLAGYLAWAVVVAGASSALVLLCAVRLRTRKARTGSGGRIPRQRRRG